MGTAAAGQQTAPGGGQPWPPPRAGRPNARAAGAPPRQWHRRCRRRRLAEGEGGTQPLPPLPAQPPWVVHGRRHRHRRRRPTHRRGGGGGAAAAAEGPFVRPPRSVRVQGVGWRLTACAPTPPARGLVVAAGAPPPTAPRAAPLVERVARAAEGDEGKWHVRVAQLVFVRKGERPSGWGGHASRGADSSSQKRYMCAGGKRGCAFGAQFREVPRPRLILVFFFF